MRILLIFFAVIFSYESVAVQYVYRVDSRPPDVVFRDGFRSHGNNRNLPQHIRGDSCAAGSRDSAFIATTSDINETYNIARQYFSNSLFHGQLYRYRIRANNSFYSLAPSVQLLRERGVTFSRFEEIMMREQSEIVADGRIPTENIAEAVQLNYDRTSGVVSDGNGTTNSRFLNISTDSNPGIIPDIPFPQVSVRQRINAFGSLITACFSLRGSRDDDNGEYVDVVTFYDARPVLKTLLISASIR
ncbi:scabin-related ADP-ribosyltransferase [Escherichia coli]|nr:pertussis toxin-like subunit ArtA [Escherichia coli]